MRKKYFEGHFENFCFRRFKTKARNQIKPFRWRIFSSSMEGFGCVGIRKLSRNPRRNSVHNTESGQKMKNCFHKTLLYSHAAKIDCYKEKYNISQPPIMVRVSNQLWLQAAAIYGYWQPPNMVSGKHLGGTILVAPFMSANIFFEFLTILVIDAI